MSMNTWLLIAIIILLLWAVGFFALPGIGSLIHILLVIAVILIIVWLVTGKKLWR
ncbi:MAG TPA: lmo0937 family membrane protein [Candidatus Bathyarchaeia archaeon]